MKVVKKIEMTAEEEEVILAMRDMCKEFAEQSCKENCDADCPFYWMCARKFLDDNKLLETFNRSIFNLM